MKHVFFFFFFFFFFFCFFFFSFQAARDGDKKEAGGAAVAGDNFGVAPLNRSETRAGRIFAQISDLGSGKFKVGDKVLLRGRVDSTRGKGNLCFVVIRQRVSTLQCVLVKEGSVSKEMVKFGMDLHVESLVDIEGTVLKSEQAVDSCTGKENNPTTRFYFFFKKKKKKKNSFLFFSS